MTRFEQKPTPLLYAAITASTLTVFVADILTPLGVAVWIFYLVPMFLSLFLWRPSVPFVMAAVSTVAIILGFFLSPSGVNPSIPRTNRALGAATIWLIAGMGYQFIRNKLQVRKQEWFQTGQTELSELLRGEQSLHQLAEKAISYLARYLEAQIGVLFVKDSELFRRYGGYSLPATGVPDRLVPGEGLAGQAGRERRAFIVRDVPEDYFGIISGLGHRRPRHLLVAPLTADKTVNAILELGFFHSVYQSDLEFLDRVAESIGIAIRSCQGRLQIQQLLEETQGQAEELQLQGEELRVSNEELTEQSRALRESQSRLEVQQTELEQTNQQLEEQTKVLEKHTEELTRAKAELEKRAQELAQSSRYKSDFLASMSHELRTPLNSSLILAKLLAENREGNLTPEQVKYAETIESAGNDLLGLITDILDLSKIEAGRMEVKVAQVGVTRLLDNLSRTFQPLAADKGLEFHTIVAQGAPQHLDTDLQKLEQVLKNIISNAIKFTEKGTVELEVHQVQPGSVAFEVRDTGIGIPADHHELIFEPFRQVDGVANRKSGGTGLGLSISREFATLLGGRIDLKSQAGRGSTFTVTLPQVYDKALSTLLRKSQAKPAAAPATTATPRVEEKKPEVKPERSESLVEDDREILTGTRRIVLLVEDDPTFAGILRDLAHDLGFQCVIAATAEDGIILARQYVPSAVLLDVGLPDNSGLTVLDRLKRDPRTRHVPVHVISAGDYSETAFEMGAMGYMLKPVKREQLVEAFKQFEEQISHGVRRVLVVEDDPRQLESLRRLLGTKDVETVGARNSAECLNVLRTTSVDCMVLDLNLPDASGFSLLETMAQEETCPFPPVIIYTGRDLSSEEEQRLRRYSKSIIIKGAKSPERLLDEVTLFLHQVISELPADKQKLLEKASNRDAALEGKRILVVEDDVRNIFALTSVLEQRGAIVQVARNGREALNALDQAGADPAREIHLVFMDIMMPEMDGLTAMREIRRRDQWKKLPIIALTAKAMKADQEACLAAGANDYMPKPLDVEKLLSLARVWISR